MLVLSIRRRIDDNAPIYYGKKMMTWRSGAERKVGFPLLLLVSGFSLDSGHRITRSRDLTVVSGAPRANHNGAVLLLKKGGDTSSKLLVEHTLYGPGLASSFGYDVAVVDLNGDGYEDF